MDEPTLDGDDWLQQLVGRVSDREKQRLRELMAGARAMARTAIAQARAAPREAQAATLAAIAATVVASLDQQVEAGLSRTPEAMTVKQSIACQKGCAFCCYGNVSATVMEAIAIALAIVREERADLIARVVESAPVLKDLDAAARQAKRWPCPMLQDNACSIYETRPSVCRAYLSLNAKQCEDDLNSRAAGGGGKDIPMVALSRVLANVLNAGIRAACTDEGLQDGNVELTAALNLIFNDATVIDRWLAGEAVFQPYS